MKFAILTVVCLCSVTPRPRKGEQGSGYTSICLTRSITSRTNDCSFTDLMGQEGAARWFEDHQKKVVVVAYANLH